MSANVVTLTTANWEKEVEQSDKPVLVDFWAVWCGPCRMLAPNIDKVAEQFAGKVKVGKLDIDENPDLAVRFAISGIPQVMIFKGAEKVEQVAGYQSVPALTQLINRVLEAPAASSQKTA
jgi:thioredoxin 1